MTEKTNAEIEISGEDALSEIEKIEAETENRISALKAEKDSRISDLKPKAIEAAKRAKEKADRVLRALTGESRRKSYTEEEMENLRKAIREILEAAGEEKPKMGVFLTKLTPQYSEAAVRNAVRSVCDRQGNSVHAVYVLKTQN